MKPFFELFPDAIPRDRIQQYLFKRTGTLVSKHRITRWINDGEIRLVKRPRREGGGKFTRKCWLDKLIERHTGPRPLEQTGGLPIPRISGADKSSFCFPYKPTKGGSADA